MNHEQETHNEAREAQAPVAPDWRRLEVARERFLERVTDGITQASVAHDEIDTDTARMIANVLGRAYGQNSALATFGRTGNGSYPELREEYLPLYRSEHTDGITKEWINWFGTYLVEQENAASRRSFTSEHQPATPVRPLMPTTIPVSEGEALQAFLSLPGVDVNNEMLIDAFHENYVGTYSSPQDVVHWMCEIDEWQAEVTKFAEERGLFIDGYTVDYDKLLDQLREGYDLVERKGQVHVFYK